MITIKSKREIELMREAGHAEDVIKTVFWDNPISFYGQSGQINKQELENSAEFDQSSLFQGNSVLRGQAAQKQ